MISKNSFKSFVLINGFIFILSICQFKATNLYQMSVCINLLIVFAFMIFRNYILILFLTHNTRNKKQMINNPGLPIERYKYEFHLRVFSSTSIEAITYVFIKNNIAMNTSIILYDFIYFIPISFTFELIFDLFHYLSHRLLHSNKYLYKNIHKEHHNFQYVTPIITFYQNPIDLIISNSIPTILTLLIIPKMTLFNFNAILVYKSFIEISGHSGKQLYPNTSFIQFRWMPIYLNIQLYSEDHFLHHHLNNCNYSKRFSLWDKAFGTYTPMKQLTDCIRPLNK